MSIEDVLAEWEKTKQAAKEAMEREEKLRLEEARAHALKRTEDILERLLIERGESKATKSAAT